MSAATHPRNVQPRNRLKTPIASLLRCLPVDCDRGRKEVHADADEEAQQDESAHRCPHGVACIQWTPSTSPLSTFVPITIGQPILVNSLPCSSASNSARSDRARLTSSCFVAALVVTLHSPLLEISATRSVLRTRSAGRKPRPRCPRRRNRRRRGRFHSRGLRSLHWSVL